MLNGSLECELREYVIFEGDRKSFVAGGGKLKGDAAADERRPRREDRDGDRRRRFDRRDSHRDDRREGRRFEGKDRDRADRFSRDDRRKPYERDERRFSGRFNQAVGHSDAVDSENPFAKRRNPHALKSLSGRTPKLPPVSGPVMRSRGWKKRQTDDDSNTTE